MPRRKSYVDPHPLGPAPEGEVEEKLQVPQPDADGGLIDLKALAPDGRFTDSKSKIHLQRWLGKGIDTWVWASVAAIKAMLFSGKCEIGTLISSGLGLNIFFEFLTAGRRAPIVGGPGSLAPIHMSEFTEWIKIKVAANAFSQDTARQYYQSVKRVLVEMMEQGFLNGNKSKLFPRGAVKRQTGVPSRQVSFSADEQERIAKAIKTDLSCAHNGSLELLESEIQALRFLSVSHRQGANLTPLLELDRVAGMAPGIMPKTVLIRTEKHRGKSVRRRMGRAAAPRSQDRGEAEELVPFTLAEGAVIQQAIQTTAHLVELAPQKLKTRVWLYKSSSPRDKRDVVCTLTPATLVWCTQRVIARHNLVGDDGKPLRVNTSRFRKSFFDRAWQVTGGSVAFTANLLGNSAPVAATRYPSVNAELQAEAAAFLKNDYIDRLRGNPEQADEKRVIEIVPVKESGHLESTPVSRCQNPVDGQHAPHDGNPCTRFVMCLFCSSFAIVGSELDLWKIFSFQAFAKCELEYLDQKLGAERTPDDEIEDLRDRYRVVIPYITSFTDRQFSSTVVQRSRRKTADALHPFWQLQSANSERARSQVGG